jgi:hypothetical protein
VVVLTKSWVEQPASVRPSPGRRRRCSWAQRCARCARLKLPTWRRARSTRPTRGRGGRKRFRPRRPCSPLRGPLTGWERSPTPRRAVPPLLAAPEPPRPDLHLAWWAAGVAAAEEESRWGDGGGGPAGTLGRRRAGGDGRAGEGVRVQGGS